MPNPSYYSATTNLINYIQSSATSHVLVRSFGQGELDDHSIVAQNEDQILYPRVFLEYPMVGQYTTPVINWKLVIVVTDIELKERTDEVDKLAITWDIMNDLLEKFRQENQSYILKDDTINILSLTEYSDDYCAGWRCEFQLDQAIPMNKCNIDDRFTPADDRPIINIIPHYYIPVKNTDTEDVYYTQDKRFSIDNSGNTITSEGYVLLSNVTEVTFTNTPYDDGFTVSSGGIISHNGQDFQVYVVTFYDYTQLNNIGNGYYIATGGSGAPITSLPQNVGATLKLSY